MSFQGLEFSGDTEPNSRQFPPVGTGQEQLLSDVSKAQEQLKDPVGWAPRWPVPKSSRLIPKLAGNRQRFPHVWSSEIRTPRRIWSRKTRSWLPALRHTGDFGFWTVPVLWFFLCFSRFLFFFERSVFGCYCWRWRTSLKCWSLASSAEILGTQAEAVVAAKTFLSKKEDAGDHGALRWRMSLAGHLSHPIHHLFFGLQMNIFKTRIEPGGRFMSSEWDLHCSRDLPFGQRRNKRQGGEWDYNRIAEVLKKIQNTLFLFQDVDDDFHCHLTSRFPTSQHILGLLDLSPFFWVFLAFRYLFQRPRLMLTQSSPATTWRAWRERQEEQTTGDASLLQTEADKVVLMGIPRNQRILATNTGHFGSFLIHDPKVSSRIDHFLMGKGLMKRGARILWNTQMVI